MDNHIKYLFNNYQSIIGRWGERTFPESTKWSIYRHIKKEVKELEKAIMNDDKSAIMEEAADICLLLMHLAYKCCGNLIVYVLKKFKINKKRKWKAPDKYGVSEHVR